MNHEPDVVNRLVDYHDHISGSPGLGPRLTSSGVDAGCDATAACLPAVWPSVLPR